MCLFSVSPGPPVKPNKKVPDNKKNTVVGILQGDSCKVGLWFLFFQSCADFFEVKPTGSQIIATPGAEDARGIAGYRTYYLHVLPLQGTFML